MNDFRRTNTERSAGADPAVTALLRAAYAAPTDDNYWHNFEQRVMSRIQESAPVAWWSVFSEWRHAGLVAATLGLIVAGATIVREQSLAANARQIAAGAAYYTVFDGSVGDVSVEFSATHTDGFEAPERYLDPLYP
jgi:hypothetical protein